MSTMKTARALAAAGALLLAACGDDAPTQPTGPTRPSAESLTGAYSVSWLMQVHRTSDNFMTSFTCSGSMTLQQGPSGDLTGFSVVGTPCPPVSFPLRGRVQAGDAIEFVTGGPRPPQGPCPAAGETTYTGIATNSGRRISARGVATVSCPEFGEHTFTYIVTAAR